MSRPIMNLFRLRDYDGNEVVVRIEDYDGVIPGGSERIRALIESETAHRRLIASRQRQVIFSMTDGIIVGFLALLAAALVRAC